LGSAIRSLDCFALSRRLTVAFFLCVGLASPAWSQEQKPPDPQTAVSAPEANPGSIHGIVQNREGVVYEGAHITLKSPSPAAEQTTTSDSDGRFSFFSVPPGPFELTLDSGGFASQTVSGTLHPGENYATPPIVLLIAIANTEVQVTASRSELAQEDLKQEEHQRVFGVIPNFYVVYDPDAPPLTARQKYHLAWRSSIDPVTIAVVSVVAGIEQGNNDFREYGQGTQGYAKRFGAAYADGFIGDMLGGAVLPSIFKQDPRYFYKGKGSIRSRTLYAIAMSVICKGDNGHWQFNYSGVAGGLAAAGISNIYYPDSERNGASLIFRNTGIGIGSSAIGNLFQEFLVRKLTPKVPDYSSGKP
jgi:hypothetical protein